MNITVRTLTSTSLVKDVQPSTSIAEFKEKLHKDNVVDFGPECQKLVFKDAVLEKGTLSQAGVSNEAVAIVLKRRPPPAPPSPDPTPVPTRESIREFLKDFGGSAVEPSDLPSLGALSGSSARSQNTFQLHSLLDAVAGLINAEEERRGTRGSESAQSPDTQGAAGEGEVDPQEPHGGADGDADGDADVDADEDADSDADEDADDDVMGAEEVAEALATVPAGALQQLLDMGFPDARARKALVLHRCHVPAAMDWLLEHGDSPEADAPLSRQQLLELRLYQGLTPPPTRTARDEPQAEAEGEARGGPVALMREPDASAIQSLVGMGFSESDAAVALRLANNNQELACAWLLDGDGPSMHVEVLRQALSVLQRLHALTDQVSQRSEAERSFGDLAALDEPEPAPGGEEADPADEPSSPAASGNPQALSRDHLGRALNEILGNPNASSQLIPPEINDLVQQSLRRLDGTRGARESGGGDSEDPEGEADDDSPSSASPGGSPSSDAPQ